MVTSLVTLIILAASFLFAMLGLGGGMVYVPVLKWAGFDVKSVAIPLGLLLNGLNTLLALVPFARKKLVDWKGGMAIAVAALLAAPIGAHLAQYLPVNTLMLLFSAAVVAAAIRMIWTAKREEPTEMMPLTKRSVLGVGVGALAGFMGGMLGIGGGFILAPILMWMGYKTKAAAATTAFVVTFSSFSGYLGHMAKGNLDWTITALVVMAVVLGSQLGGFYMTDKAKPRWVKQVYAVVLFAIAVKLIVGVF